ncbi:rho/rac/cdc gtpase-activating protein [Anaeramoeba flamelloides]|uniref:Rho/rac/cdc gtpase-activating protein n=1 Tax=Anaeramoeba flamelloides TaxID=1746091 RepID=A0AAV8A7H1_9EUKA|nr:rho/rac/cdc gtpase-activating protein [Anaeramoeba flamelloides]
MNILKRGFRKRKPRVRSKFDLLKATPPEFLQLMKQQTNREIHTTFGTDLNDLVEIDGDQEKKIPNIIKQIINLIIKKFLDSPDLFKTSGDVVAVAMRKFEIDQTGRLNEETEIQPNVLTDLMKKFFLELSEPLFTKDLHEEWVIANDLIHVDELIKQLPEYHFHLLKEMIRFLKIIVENNKVNNISSTDLDRILTPFFLSITSIESETNGIPIKIMIENFESLFQEKRIPKNSKNKINKKKPQKQKLSKLVSSIQNQHLGVLLEIPIPELTKSQLLIEIKKYDTEYYTKRINFLRKSLKLLINKKEISVQLEQKIITPLLKDELAIIDKLKFKEWTIIYQLLLIEIKNYEEIESNKMEDNNIDEYLFQIKTQIRQCNQVRIILYKIATQKIEFTFHRFLKKKEYSNKKKIKNKLIDSFSQVQQYIEFKKNLQLIEISKFQNKGMEINKVEQSLQTLKSIRRQQERNDRFEQMSLPELHIERYLIKSEYNLLKEGNCQFKELQPLKKYLKNIQLMIHYHQKCWNNDFQISIEQIKIHINGNLSISLNNEKKIKKLYLKLFLKLFYPNTMSKK